MKRRLALLIGTMICASVAAAGEVKVQVAMSTGPEDEPATTFAADTPKLFAIFKTAGIKSGDKVHGVLIAEDVGDVAPANTKVLDETLTLDEDTDDGDFNFGKPTNGWPVGKYRVDISVNNELAAKARFTIEPAGETEEEAQESAQIPEEKKLKSLTENSLLAFGEAVKKEDFSGFYEDIATVWQKETTPEKLQEAFKDFYGKKIDIPSAVKKLEPVFNRPAAIDSDGELVIRGYYPTKPNRVLFELKYLEEEGDWKLVGIDVNLKE